MFATWGANWLYTPTVAAGGGVVTNVSLSGIGIVQGLGVRNQYGQHWLHAHMGNLQSLYNESLRADAIHAANGQIHYDQNTGEKLTTWDIIMSHIQPIQHSFLAGHKTTLWHRLSPGVDMLVILLQTSKPSLTVRGLYAKKPQLKLVKVYPKSFVKPDLQKDLWVFIRATKPTKQVIKALRLI